MSSGRQIGYAQIGLGIVAALAGFGVAALLLPPRHAPAGQAADHRLGGPHPDAPMPARSLDHPPSPARADVTIAAGRRLNRASGLLAFSVLADSGVEHYRGSFNNRVMYTPLVVSALALAVSLHGLADDRAGMHRARHATYLATALTGVIGTAFHIYNVATRPGGFDWQNLFYGAPLGAPAAIMLSGFLGAMAETIRDTPAGARPSVLGVPAGRAMAGVTAVGMLGTSGEAALLHFRGAFHDPFMLLPVSLPPIAAALLARLAIGRMAARHIFTRWWLRLTGAMGLAGAGFHAYGVARNMGGWRNWSQNILNGPPLPAPPSFTGLALAGLAAVTLLEDHRDA